MRKIIFSPPDVDVRVFENVDSAIVDSLVVQLSKIKILVVKNYYCCGLILDLILDGHHSAGFLQWAEMSLEPKIVQGLDHSFH